MTKDIQIAGQITLFDYLGSLAQSIEEDFNPLLRFAAGHLGSYVGSKERVLELFINGASKQEKIKKLKDEFGIGGFAGYRFTPDNTYALEGASYDAKGIVIEWYEPGKVQADYNTSKYSYAELVDAIEKLFKEGKYNSILFRYY
jgi:hypothetical protein